MNHLLRLSLSFLFLLNGTPSGPVKLEYNLKLGHSRAWKFSWKESGTTISGRSTQPLEYELTLDGALLQRVMSTGTDGYLLSVDLAVKKVRMLMDKKEVPGPAGPLRQRSLILIDRSGRVFSAQIESATPGMAELSAVQSLQQVAIVQFPYQAIDVGETWTVAIAPKTIGRLTNVEMIDGKQVAKVEMRTEVSLRSSPRPGSKVPRPQVTGNLVMEATQFVELETGMTTTAEAKGMVEVELKGDQPIERKQSLKTVLQLTPIRVEDAMAAQAREPTQPPRKTSVPTLPTVRLKRGEIKAEGVIDRMGGVNTFIMKVDSFTNDRGRKAHLPTPKAKVIRVDAKTEFFQIGVIGKLTASALTPHLRIAAIGKEAGSSKPLPARRVDIMTPPPVPASPPQPRSGKEVQQEGKGSQPKK